jgi:flavin-dependent dehydrogenase
LKSIILVGGGISGLVTAIQLARAGFETTLIEKKVYPFHRVCGEYISNETVPFLKRLGLYPESLSPRVISRFQLTSVGGKSVFLPLATGGFGISRYVFDQFLYDQARTSGVRFLLNSPVDRIDFRDQKFEVQVNQRKMEADYVVGSFGKRSTLDTSLCRAFIKKRSPYIGVKYHIRTDHPGDLIALHNFYQGYCGISNIEDGKSNLCYLSHRSNLKNYGTLKAMEENVLFRNPFLKSIFSNSEFLFEKPETINEISFATKGPVDQHILMAGDAAGMITPLCGNGMAMAIHSSKLLAETLIRSSTYPREQVEQEYALAWKKAFKWRLWVGRKIQGGFGGEMTSSGIVNLARYAKPVARWLVRKTHGSPF